MKPMLNVLLIEDQEDDALLIEQELRRGGFEPNCLRVETAGALNGALVAGLWDVVISDYTLPQFSGVQALDYVHRIGIDVPFIIVSGTISEETAVAAMKAGAHDYVMKSNLHRLVPAVQRELKEAIQRQALRDAESQLRQAERLKTIGEQMAALIHDLSNPLQTILGLAEILKNSDLTPEKRSKHVDTIGREVEMIVGMRNDIMDFTRGELRITHDPIDLARIVREVEETYGPVCASFGITLTCSYTSEPGATPVIRGDRVKIWRVLQNLITNARDAMPSGGRISVDVNSTENGVAIQVSDNGAGIPEEIRDKLFTPFVTQGKTQGTGLGLAIVKRIVEAHAGTVTFLTEERVGTTFTLAFPRSTETNTILAHEPV